VVVVDGPPFIGRIGLLAFWLVDEIAALAVAAVPFFCEGMASFGLVGSVMFQVDLELFWAVCELALDAVGAISFFCEVLAEGTLGFGGTSTIDVSLL
jgi:hypothetical protein